MFGDVRGANLRKLGVQRSYSLWYLPLASWADGWPSSCRCLSSASSRPSSEIWLLFSDVSAVCRTPSPVSRDSFNCSKVKYLNCCWLLAITLVALGTSLPDLFASKTAACQERHADNAIGNITGSNSVNVFLGLGLPWVIASMYHQAKVAPSFVCLN